ncbi:hypothetical protein KR018_004956 [Drosophila ironensis]|nr:hypothetical protein KR018_004956 [Drosophila ironensis]
MMLNIVRPKGRVTPFRKSFPKLFSLEIMSTFNYDGDCKKSSFRAFKQINRTLFGE